MHDVEERLAKILVDNFGVDWEKITPMADFRADMAADSLDLLDLTLPVEDTFGIEIGDDAASALHTVGDLIALLGIQRA